ncbi:hypothetical protein INR77_10155 [Erythrobacter sp. SCSIO 43205]|uniref:hypothetical protein n=1 Tax=Erythrobacter sp. SCSIO 43205 TaxID=2779361 RepID=UPI001CAA3495|nr:hypothetical protein [Erythrobacter sp. SCSIO 43205]UAB77185.1 hypothetical protein INR77_10155 [Erythrobacter sp. SCSIO 43205]
MKTKILSTALAFTALASAQAAAAQQTCVESADLSDTVTYAMPVLYDAVQGPCSAEFAASEFMTSEADAFIAQFAELQDQAWPGTLRLLKVFMAADAAEEGKGEDPMLAAFEQMPPEALRPLVDVFVGEMIRNDLAKDLKPSTCVDIAEAMELVSPLPPENIGGLAGFLARVTGLDNPAVCGTPQAAQKAK